MARPADRSIVPHKKGYPDLSATGRLAIIRLSSIGDVVHALPVSAALGEAYPNLQITWIVEEMSADVVIGNPYLHEVIVIPRSRWKRGRLRSPAVWREYIAFLIALRRRRFNVVLDLQGYAKSALLSMASGARYRLGWWRLRDGSSVISTPIPHDPHSIHRVDWFLDVARALGAPPDEIKFPLDIPDAARARISAILQKNRVTGPYAVLNPAAGNLARRWSAENYAALAVGLAERFALISVLIGTARDAAVCDAVRSISADKLQGGSIRPPLNLVGKTSIKELAAVLSGAAVHVCGDTGSAHIAAALKIPTVALYGPTDPEYAGPWGQSDNVLARRDLCSPRCTERKCAFVAGKASGAPQQPGAAAEHVARCLSSITVDDVLERIGQVLNERK